MQLVIKSRLEVSQARLLCVAAEKIKFPLRISSVNVTKYAVSCEAGYIYWRNPSWKTSFFVQCVLMLAIVAEKQLRYSLLNRI